MEYTVRQLKAEIADVAARIGHPLPGLSKYRKDELNALLSQLRARAAAQAVDSAMAELDRRNTAGLTTSDYTTQTDASTDPREEAALDEFEASLVPVFSHAGRRTTTRQRAHRRTINRMRRTSRRRNRRR
jgi:hypothetical protein